MTVAEIGRGVSTVWLSTVVSECVDASTNYIPAWSACPLVDGVGNGKIRPEQLSATSTPVFPRGAVTGESLLSRRVRFVRFYVSTASWSNELPRYALWVAYEAQQPKNTAARRHKITMASFQCRPTVSVAGCHNILSKAECT